MGNMAFGSTLNPINGKRERLTVSTSAVGFAPANFTVAATEKNSQRLAGGAMLQVGGDEIYWTVDGSTPSSTVGFKNSAGDVIYLDSAQKVRAFKAIRVTTDTYVEATFLFGN